MLGPFYHGAMHVHPGQQKPIAYWQASLHQNQGKLGLDPTTWAMASRSLPWKKVVQLWVDLRKRRCLAWDLLHGQLCRAYARGHWSLALNMLGEMRPRRASHDLVSYNMASSAAQNAGQWKWVSLSCSQMWTFHLVPDAATYCIAVTAAQGARQWQQIGDSLHILLRQSLVPNVVLYNAVISTSAKVVAWLQALQYAEAMPEKHIRRDVITHNAVINAWDRSRQWQRALRAFVLLEASVQPNAVSSGSCVAACQRSIQWEVFDLSSKTLGTHS